MTVAVQSGLEGVVAAETRISGVDGLAGELILAGFPLEELASQATFEETLFLLWNDRLPNTAELQALSTSLAAQRTLPEAVVSVLRAAAADGVPVMDALRMAAGMLDLGVGHESDGDLALAIVARFPAIVAATWRLKQGKEPLASRPDLSHAANYLYLLFGEVPSTARIRGMETYLNTIVDHGLNASTFAARVIVATDSDLVSAVVGAVGALKGPLHGGAPGPALDMVFEIGSAERAEPVLRSMLERGDRLMGFGHRIYKVRDPRADVLAAAADTLFHQDADRDLYALALDVEQTALRLLEEYKPGRNLQTNVEFYTALLLHGLGLPTELFTPTFAIGRVVGWLAHCFEQQRLHRIFRPQSVYTGPKDRCWVSLEGRGE